MFKSGRRKCGFDGGRGEKKEEEEEEEEEGEEIKFPDGLRTIPDFSGVGARMNGWMIT